MKRGTAFYLSEECQSVDSHLQIVISDTERYPQQVVIVGIMTWKEGREPTCIIERGEHPCLTRTSCVSYKYIKITSVDDLFRLRDSGKINIVEDASPSLVDKIRDCAGNSVIIDDKKGDVLVEQNIIKLED